MDCLKDVYKRQVPKAFTTGINSVGNNLTKIRTIRPGSTLPVTNRRFDHAYGDHLQYKTPIR